MDLPKLDIEIGIDKGGQASAMSPMKIEILDFYGF